MFCCFQQTVFCNCVFQTIFFENPLFRHCSKNGSFRKVAENRLQTPKHKTLTSAQRIAWNHSKAKSISIQNQTFNLVQNLTFKRSKIGPAPNFTACICVCIYICCKVKKWSNFGPFKVKSGPMFFLFFLFLFLKISFSLQKEEDFWKTSKNKKEQISKVKKWSNYVAQHNWTTF